MGKKHLLSLTSLEASEISFIVDRMLFFAKAKIEGQPLKNKVIGIYFRKTSTRTRTSFTAGAMKLGATTIAYGPNDLQVNTGETIQDTARVLSGYLDALVMRTAEGLEEMQILAAQNRMSVINAMSDKEHPTQAISDLGTIKEHFGQLEDLHILYLGEGNSTAAALALAVSTCRNMKLTLLTAEHYGLPDEILGHAHANAQKYDAHIEQYHHLDYLPRNVDVVYTTRWCTTGSTKHDPKWREHFRPFSVTQSIMDQVSKPHGTVFMHDLPAVREEDVTDEVLNGPQSIVFHQAENKLYGAMAVLEWCLLDY